jgi:hypothetical protein
MHMLQPAVVDCPLVYDLYEVLDLLEINRPPRQEASGKPA